MHESLMERTFRLLKDSDESLPEIYAGLNKRGSKISFYWLRKFSAGEFQDPSVNRVEELYEYLTGTPVLASTTAT